MRCWPVVDPTPSMTDPLRSLLRASHHLPADRFAAVVQEHGRLLGSTETVAYLADYGGSALIPIGGHGVPARREVPVEGSVGGLAFRRVQVIRPPVQEDGVARLWVPILDGAERLGVLEFLFEGAISEAEEGEARSFASLAAELLVTRDAYSDVFSRLRRKRPLTLSAEMQWDLLPPLSFGTESAVISGALEPSYEIGGDTFDYAVNGPTADLLVLDAVGHGLPAALLATTAIGAYRYGRRQERSLPEAAAVMNEVIGAHFPGSAFATAVLARLDLDTGRLRWVNAGHPPPLVLRGGSLVRPPQCPPDRPLGLQDRPAHECWTDLEPGDRILLYTDGIVEARSPEGTFFGEDRLADFVVRAEAAGDPPPETLRRLMRSVLEHQAGQLQDDASIVLVEWRTGREQQLLV